MKEDTTIQVLTDKIQALSAVTNRALLSSKLGYGYSGDRDIYETLGYKKELTFTDFSTQYLRQDMAKAIIDRPANKTWSGSLLLKETENKENSQFENEWKVLSKDLKLKSKFLQLDKLTGLGKYGILLIGFDDVKEITDFSKNVASGKRKILFVKPFSMDVAKVEKTVTDTTNPRYGLPLTYLFNSINTNSDISTSVEVHYSRVIHVVDDILDSEIEGLPRLQVVFNRLKDLEKLVGGSAEMFWRGARPGYHGNIKEDYQKNAETENDLQDQLDEYENNLRRILMTEGVDIKNLETQVSDPKNHVDIQIQMISAVTGIPKRILTGSERGELSSKEDKNQWAGLIMDRRDEFATPRIIHPFVELCQKYKILPDVEEWYVDWTDLFAMGEKEKAEIGEVRAKALKLYNENPMLQSILTPTMFYRFFLGLKEEEIQLIEQTGVNEFLKEEKELKEEEETENE